MICQCGTKQSKIKQSTTCHNHTIASKGLTSFESKAVPCITWADLEIFDFKYVSFANILSVLLKPYAFIRETAKISECIHCHEKLNFGEILYKTPNKVSDISCCRQCIPVSEVSRP